MPVECVTFKGTFIDVKVGENQTPSDLPLPIEKDSLIERAVRPLLHTPPIHGVIMPLPFIYRRVNFVGQGRSIRVFGDFQRAELVAFFLDVDVFVVGLSLLILIQCQSHPWFRPLYIQSRNDRLAIKASRRPYKILILRFLFLLSSFLPTNYNFRSNPSSRHFLPLVFLKRANISHFFSSRLLK